MKKLIFALILVNVAYAGWHVFQQSFRSDAEGELEVQSYDEMIILVSELPEATTD